MDSAENILQGESMKIIWLVNQPLPAISRCEGLPVKVTEGWLVGLSEVLVKESVCFPQSFKQEGVKGETDGYAYYGFYKKNVYSVTPAGKVRDCLKQFLQTEMPDIIHLMGTEFSHGYEMFMACNDLKCCERMVVSVQGLAFCCAEEYMGGLTKAVFTKQTLRDMLLRDGLKKQKKKMAVRGEWEKKLLIGVRHVIGRTDWDYETVKKINSEAIYHKNNENLRSIFYECKWEAEKSEPFRIFIGQITYPLKGFHFALQALAQLQTEFPSAKIYVAGRNIEKKAVWRRTYYQKYLLTQIKELGLTKKVIFLGELPAEEICRQYLRANVFVLPSVIENSSNALGEAMLLGVPCVAARVGGTPTVLKEGKEGLLYSAESAEELSDCIRKIFTDGELAGQISAAARRHAGITHDRKENCKELLHIYRSVCGEYGGKNA